MYAKVRKRSRSLLQRLVKFGAKENSSIDMLLKDQTGLLIGHQPMRFVRRIILRRHGGALPPKRFKHLNLLHRRSANRANKMLAILTRDIDPADGFAVRCRSLVYAKFAEYGKYANRLNERDLLMKSSSRSLKKVSQLVGMCPTDQDFTPRVQEALEEFYEVHEIPNQAEYDFLATTLRCDQHALRQWCKPHS